MSQVGQRPIALDQEQVWLTSIPYEEGNYSYYVNAGAISPEKLVCLNIDYLDKIEIKVPSVRESD